MEDTSDNKSKDLKERKRLYALYDYYGIRDGYFTEDDDDLDPRFCDEIEAMSLLREGLSLPDDLATRLLQYKAEDEKAEKIRLHELYKYYGIRDAYFTSEDDTSQRYSDELDAMDLFNKGKSLPYDLATRLLQYKAEDEANKTNK